MATTLISRVDPSTSFHREDIPRVAERKTEELVIGMVGPVGSGVSFTAQILSNKLKADYGYDGNTVILSELINRAAGIVGENSVDSTDPQRISKLQTIGNKLRDKFGHTYIAELCVRHINQARGDPAELPRPRRHFTILDSLKNPDEAKALRDVYEDAFWLIGVFAPERVRSQRLEGLGHQASYIAEVFKRDQAEGLVYGQDVRGTMQLADYYIRNDSVNDANVNAAMNRFLAVMFGIDVPTPTQDERAMQAAASVGVGSACLSRQVGAVIVSKSGEFIGQGMNDVPKLGGGLYTASDGVNDNRCWQWKGRICHNDDRKDRLLQRIIVNLREAGVLQKGAETKAAEAVARSDIANLIEFSRSVHAEAEAIISVARSGKSGLIGSILYSTVFPCHGCARLIVASGISKVIYIEPYSKSLAIDLHSDVISTDESDWASKVVFLQYEGVAPRRMIRLFAQQGDRKYKGKFRALEKRGALPASRAPLDGFAVREQLVVADLSKREATPNSERPKDVEADRNA